MSPAQDAGDTTRLLEAPSPLVLMVVVVPSWWWRQRRKPSIALRMDLTRLIPPGTLARLILPAVLTRLVAPLLAGAAVIPAYPTSTSSATVASIVVLGETTKAPIADGLVLLTVIGVVVVHAVEDAEWAAALG